MLRSSSSDRQFGRRGKTSLRSPISPAISDIKEVMGLSVSETYTSILCGVLLHLIDNSGGRDEPLVAPLYLQPVTSKTDESTGFRNIHQRPVG